MLRRAKQNHILSEDSAAADSSQLHRTLGVAGFRIMRRGGLEPPMYVFWTMPFSA